jgi:hypothetical protein
VSIYQTRPLTDWRRIGNVQWRFEFKAVDAWIGAFWTQWELWLCLLPCLPLHLQRIRGQCEHKGCRAEGQPCFYDEYSEEPGIYLCDAHLNDHCFCSHCGQFYGGIEASHFVHPGLCDGCAALPPCWRNAGYIDDDDEDEYG